MEKNIIITWNENGEEKEIIVHDENEMREFMDKTHNEKGIEKFKTKFLLFNNLEKGEK